MQKSQNGPFLCLMLMAQENIITACITDDSNEVFFTFLFNFSALCLWWIRGSFDTWTMKMLHFSVDLYTVAFQCYKKIATKKLYKRCANFNVYANVDNSAIIWFFYSQYLLFSRFTYFHQSTRKLVQFRPYFRRLNKRKGLIFSLSLVLKNRSRKPVLLYMRLTPGSNLTEFFNPNYETRSEKCPLEFRSIGIREKRLSFCSLKSINMSRIKPEPSV